MELSLIHAGLAAGAALAAVPLIIHLVMRQTPKRIVFPALQLLQNRHKRSTKRLRVKNWLLLLARMALVALMALALARPALNARVPLGDREVPTALALVVDTSLSMGYVDRGKTRLDEAKEAAGQVLRRMPETSEVYLIDSAVPAVPAPISPAAARKRLEGLGLKAANRPLNQGVERAYEALADSRRDLARLEVYVFTDLARSSWDLGQEIPGRDRIKQRSGREAASFVIRVAPEQVRNASVYAVEARPSTEADADGRRPFEVVATIRNAGPAETRLVEFTLDGTKRDAKEVELPADGQAEVVFRTPPNLEPGPHQATVSLGGVDPLPTDDRRFVSFEASPAFRALVVYDPDEDEVRRSIDAEFVAGALDPQGLGVPNDVTTLGTNQFGERFPGELSGYACVVLNNVARLPEPAWAQLAEYLRNGGGLVIGLGSNAPATGSDGEAARAVVPGRIGDPVSPAGGTSFGDLLDPSHLLFTPYTQELRSDLASIDVFRYREFTPNESGTRTLLAYRDGAPALVEAVVRGSGVGRVLVWTTPLSRRPTPDDPDAWNEFPVQGWSFVALMQRSVPYLAGSAGARLNYEAGDVVVLPLDPSMRSGRSIVRGPSADLEQTINTPPGTAELVVDRPQAPGHWAVTPADAAEATDAADGRPRALRFSVNTRPEESDLRPMSAEDLEPLFGSPDAYALADSPDQIERVRREAIVGREIFPWLMALILLLLTAENFLANRFHRERPAPVLAPARA